MSEGTVSLNEDYRVKVEEKTHSIYKMLVLGSNKDPETTPFLALKDAFIWAFTLGVKQGKRTPLEGSKEGIFWFLQFSKDVDLAILKTVALADTKDISIIVQEDIVLTMAEEYANTGIHFLKEALLDQPGTPLWNLVNLINNAFEKKV